MLILFHLIIFKNLGFAITTYFHILISTFIEDQFPIIIYYQEVFFAGFVLLLKAPKFLLYHSATLAIFKDYLLF